MGQVVCFSSPPEEEGFLFKDAEEDFMEEGSSHQCLGKVGPCTIFFLFSFFSFLFFNRSLIYIQHYISFMCTCICWLYRYV